MDDLDEFYDFTPALEARGITVRDVVGDDADEDDDDEEDGVCCYRVVSS